MDELQLAHCGNGKILTITLSCLSERKKRYSPLRSNQWTYSFKMFVEFFPVWAQKHFWLGDVTTEFFEASWHQKNLIRETNFCWRWNFFDTLFTFFGKVGWDLIKPTLNTQEIKMERNRGKKKERQRQQKTELKNFTICDNFWKMVSHSLRSSAPAPSWTTFELANGAN